MNRVTLKFNNTLTNLAGAEFGKEIYEEQVKGKLDLNKKFEIQFPDQVKIVASSFVNSFFADIVREIGLKGLEDRLVIISNNSKLHDSIIKKLQ
ncbi:MULTISPECIES: STAS-like domain-containing protein [Eubacterium]|uniref:STAS-like domain-containing protein n=1 Tax=Eubacterium TaxID=1730 RepID=UPI0026731AE2|nr:DUF4325 domain-containing protein [Eubacterium ventriosum]